MFEFIEKLRQKSDRTKRQIAFVIALSFSGVIFIVWISVIYPDFMRGQAEAERAVSSEPSPLSTFSGTISVGFSAIGEQIGKAKESIFSITKNISDYSASASHVASTTTNRR